jgi:hypothetical protein
MEHREAWGIIPFTAYGMIEEEVLAAIVLSPVHLSEDLLL